MFSDCCSLESDSRIRVLSHGDQAQDAQEEQDAKVSNIGCGLIVGMISFLAATGIFYAIISCHPEFSISQDVIKIFSVFKNVHPLLDQSWRGVFKVYVVLLGPILEELVFRRCLNDKIEQCEGANKATWKKVARIVVVALLFGACHLSPYQNSLSNLVIFGFTTTLGLVLGILKEKTKDIKAPIAAHMVFNLMAL